MTRRRFSVAEAATTPRTDGRSCYSLVVQSPVFNISGESFRVTTTLETNSPRLLVFGVTVNRQGGRFVTSISRESPGTDSSIVNAGPGRFFLEISSLFTKYLVTVEDCAGVPPIEPHGPPGPIADPEG